jgi:F-type H+-transporting ATPase subunit b
MSKFTLETLLKFVISSSAMIIVGLTLVVGAAQSANAADDAEKAKSEHSEKADHDAKAGTHTAADAHDHHGAHGEGFHPVGASSPAQWRSDLAIYSFVVFILLMAILTKFAWGPISAALDQREAGIASNIAKAQGAADEAKAMLANYEKKLAGAADEVRAMLEEARRDAESTKTQILAEAKAAAQQESDRAIREVQTARDGALKELAEKSADLATDLAGKMLRAQMSKADHSRLVQETVSQFVSKN